jgi:uncharacterized protein YlaI
MKKCSSCREEKEIENFGINKAKKDGRMHKCKECNNRLAIVNYERLNGTKEERSKLQNELYNYILELRSAGHQLKDISEATGLDKSSISYYINNKRKVGMNAVHKYVEKCKANLVDGIDG